jgi:hypothetical protein
MPSKLAMKKAQVKGAYSQIYPFGYTSNFLKLLPVLTPSLKKKTNQANGSAASMGLEIDLGYEDLITLLQRQFV